MYKFAGRFALILMGVFVAIGVAGVCDGVRSVVAGGYADNIVLGAMIASLFPLGCWCLYLLTRELENGR